MNLRRRCGQGVIAALAAVSTIAMMALTSAGCGEGSVVGTSTSATSTTVTEPTSSNSTSSTGASPTTTSSPSTSTTTTSSPSTSTTTTAPTCSASRENTQLMHQGGLTEEVVRMRAAIFEAAMSCDYEALESLALAGSGKFTFSFGGQTEGPAAYWRSAEERGDPVLAMLVTVLNMPYAREDGLVVWPFAHALDLQNLNPAQEDLLALFFTPEEINEWKSFGGYLGYRAGISESGDWLFFVAGD